MYSHTTCYPVTRGIKLFNFMTYDRWGEQIFSTTNAGNGWDGSYKGRPCKEDVYVWKLEVTAKNNPSKNLTGYVTLYR